MTRTEIAVVLAEHGQQRGEARVARDAVSGRDPHGAAPLVGDVLQRPESRRRERAVAGGPGDPRVGQCIHEGLDQAGLPDARLPGYERQSAVPQAGIVGVRLQRGQLLVALEQVHQTTAESRSASAAAS